MRGEIGARQVAALEKFYGLSLSATPHHFQALAWDSSYRDLTERFYAELLNQTHFRPQYEAMTLVPRSGTTPYGNLMPLVPMFEAEIAADEEAGTKRLREFARSLRGRELMGETSYFAFRERFILDADGQVDEAKAFAFDSAGLPERSTVSDFSEAVRASAGRLASGYGEDVLYGAGDSAAIEGGVHGNVLYGGAGNDDLSGLEGGDVLDGGPGNDRLSGDVGRVTEGAGNDFYLFRPGSGVDRINSERGGVDTVFFGGGLRRADVRVVASNGWGGLRFELPASGDVLFFDADWWSASALERFAFSDGTVFTLDELLAPSEAPDVLLGTPGADTIDGLGGNDVISGFAGDDHLLGGEEADLLDGGEGADLLEGGAGNDHIIPSAGDDVVDGGAGNDRIDFGSEFNSGYWASGGSGNDTYRFGFGDGRDTILDAGGFDTVLFKPGVTAADVALTNEGNNLFISLAGGADGITVVDHFREGGSSTTPNFLERVQFADGTVLAAEALTNATITGTAGADTLQGYTAAQNLIVGLAGDDELFGQARADRLEGGDGADELSGRDGDDRLFGGEGDDRLFGHTEPFLLFSTLLATNEGSDLLEGGAGDDLLWSDGGDDVLDGGDGADALHGGHGSDVYDGGAGDDEYIEPMQPYTYSLGADVFLFGRGDGHDTIVAAESDWSYWYWLPGRVAGNQVVDDVVRFGPDIAPEDVTVFAETGIVSPYERHSNVRLQVAGDEASSLTIVDFLGGVRGMHLWSSVRRFEFADSTVWDRDEVLDRLTWQGTPGGEFINAGQLRDRVFGEGGNDNLYGYAGDDFIDGGAGDDFIDGGAGSDTLLGGAGSDSIHTGGHGNDRIDGGAGDDRIGHWRVDRPEAFFFNAPPRLEGDVTVVFGAGSGNDRVFLPNTRADSNDAIEVAEAPEDAKLVRREGDLLVTLPSTGDTLTVQHWFDGAAYRMETIRFSDGAEWDAERILAEVLIGTGEGERLEGYDSDDRIEGREGDDLLDGGAGADVYAFARGDGNDTIARGGGGDAIEFDAGIEPGDVLVRNRGGNMVMTLDSGEEITAIGQFSGFGFNLAEARFDDGTVWDEDMLRGRALAGTPGDDLIEGFDTDDEVTVSGGFDEVDGGHGDDLYRFESGFLVLSDRGGFDALSFGALTLDDVELDLFDGELFIEVLATGDAVTISGFAHDFSPTGNINELQFSDGAVKVSAFQVITLLGAGDAEVVFGTDFDDVLEGSENPTIIFAAGGNDLADGEGGADEIHGEAGADVLWGGRGDDELDGGGGDDRLDGGEGDDSLHGSGGDDRLDGGEGCDRIDGGSGNDTIAIGEGGGLDDVIAREAEDGGGDVTVREGFEEAYEEARNELEALEGLEDDETFESSFWSRQADGGAAADIPLDLLEPLFQLSGGVSVDFARQALQDLEVWLTTPLRQGAEWSYEQMERVARAAFVDAREQDGGNYSNDYWAELSFDFEIPGDIFGPLVQMQEGLPAREAQVVLQQLLGWLYEIVGSGEDSSRFYFFQLYGEGLVQIEEAQERLGELSTFSSGYWAESELVDFLPEDLRDRLVELGGGVDVGDAIAALEDLRDYLLQREAGGGSGEEDVIQLGEDIELGDLEIATRIDDDTGTVTELAVGIRGTNDGAIVSENGHDRDNTSSVAGLSVRVVRLEDGTELSLEEILDLADGGIGFQEGTEEPETLRGSAAGDTIEAESGDDIALGRGGEDVLRGQAGNDILGGGAGDDEAHGGPGDDIIAGEKGDDRLRGGPGNDVYLFNHGDGEDSIDAAFVEEGEAETLSFGADIAPAMVSAVLAPDGTLTLLVDGGDGGSIRMAVPLRRVQFVDEDGAVRIFDLAGLVAGRSTELIAGAGTGTLIDLFEDASAFELTGREVPAGGGTAVAYAQIGDLLAEPFYARNEPTDDGDQLAGGADDDEIDAGEGDDVVSGGAGDDTLFGGAGSDVLSGGAGEDYLDGGGGNDVARGGDGADTYLFERGDGTLTIEDSGENTLELGEDIQVEELTLSHSGGFLEIRFSTEGDLVRLAGFEPDDIFDDIVISTFYFRSGDEAVDFESLLQRGFTIEGTGQADSLGGTAIHDTIIAGDGADFLAGRAGDDVLDGGSGGDTYFFAEHDGFDELLDRESGLERNTVEFGDDIAPESLFAYLSAGDLYVEYGTHGDSFVTRSVNLGDPAQAIAFDAMRFADGATLSLVNLINGGIDIEGACGDDVLIGGSGGDRLFGLEGDDLLSGGRGGDFYCVAPGSGADTIDDISLPGEENTLVFLHPDMGAGDLGLAYNAADGTLDLLLDQETVRLAGFDPAAPFGERAIDFVQFASGESLTYAELLQLGIEIVGTEGADVLQGTAARDLIYALDGDDFIPASPGGDAVDGGAGDDVYSYNRGDGALTIVDEISTTPGNALLFGPGIALADLRNNLRFEAPSGERPGALLIDLGGEDRVRILGFDPADAEGGGHGVDTFVFTDGSAVGYRDLVRNTFIVQGDTQDDALTGTNIGDRLYGFEGADELRSGDGPDALTGGTGDDLLEGGAGGDEYVFNRGDGIDQIRDSAGFDDNFITFGPGITAADVSLAQDGADLRVIYGAGDEVTVEDFDRNAPVIRSLRFAEGSVLDIGAALNTAPFAVAALADQAALEDEAFVYVLPADAFGDADGGPLALSALLTDGTALPAWLAFDPVARAFYGTAANADVGAFTVRVLAADEYGGEVAQDFDLTVANVNDAPVVANAVADANAVQDQAFSLVIPAAVFADADAGDVLALQLGGMPAWLSFDAATRTLSGTPGNGDVGTYDLHLTATDLEGASAEDTFTVTVANVNDAPVAANAIAGQAATEDAPFSFTLPAGTFGDADAGAVLFTFAEGPAWLAYDPDTGTFSGTPANDDVGTASVTVTAVDEFGASVATDFAVAVANTNDAPLLTAPLADQFAVEDEAFSFAVSLDAFDDPDLGDALSFSAGALPAWLAFDAGTGTFSGLATNDEVGAHLVQLTATDLSGATGTGVFALIVLNVNDAPVLVTPIGDQNATAGTPFSFAFPAGTFADIDAGDSLSYTATLDDGSALPAWLSFDAATRTFSGTPTSAGEALQIRVSASDSGLASAADVFQLSVAGTGGACVPIVGTDRDDVIDGTDGDDVIDGRRGYDRMSGGAGDDVYYVDRTGSKVDLVTEGATSGYDTVYSSASYTLGSNLEELHLVGDDDLEGKGNSLANMVIGNAGDNKLYGEAGNDLLLDDEGEDRLDGGAGDDVMDGGAGDDTLIGGAGNDLYVHAKGGGDDVVLDSGGTDAIRFGAGITASNVTVRRSDKDLTLRLSDGNGSVTVKDWFSSSARRVEQVQFADGTIWDEAAIRARVTSGTSGSGGHRGDWNGCGSDGYAGPGVRGNGHDRDDDGWDGHHGGRHDHKDHHDGDCGSDDYRDAIGERLRRNPNYDFTALAQYLQRNGGGGYGAMTPQQIAQRWLQVQNCVGSLAQADDDCGGGHGGHGGHGGGYGRDDDGRGHGGWGYSGSTGQSRGCGGMDAFSGLLEGFRSL
jgi:Ca2+-binding RTX toxin-like protein